MRGAGPKKLRHMDSNLDHVTRHVNMTQLIELMLDQNYVSRGDHKWRDEKGI